MTVKKQLSSIVLLVLLMSLVGCKPVVPNTNPDPPQPPLHSSDVFPRLQETASFALPSGDIRWMSPEDISSDGDWLALIANDNQNETLWIYSPAQQQGQAIYSIPAEEVSAGRLLLLTVGWTTNNQLVFARQGTQPDGTHKGERGLLLLTADPGSGTTKELSWVPNPQDYVKQILLNQESDYVLAHVGNSLWQVPLSEASSKVVRTDFPRYDGLFFLRPSPNKSQFVYQFFEPERRGIYLLDVATGTETCLAKAGETFSFGPLWSPDEQHIAFYTANAKDDAPASGKYDILAEKYDIIEGEDAPAPIASAIGVVTAAGRKITQLVVPDMKAAMFTWASDSEHLAFLGTKTTATAAQEYPGPIFDWQALYLADLSGKVTKIADIPEETLHVVILRVQENGAYYITYSENDTALWLAQTGREPQKLELPAEIPVFDNGCFAPLYPMPTLKDSLFIGYMSEQKNYYLHIWQDQLELLAEDNTNSFLVTTPKGQVLLSSQSEDPRHGSKLTVFSPMQ